MDLDAIETVPMDRPFFRVYDTTWGYDEFNPGVGDSRFAPVATGAGTVIPHLYGGATAPVALLETALRDLDAATPDRIVYHHDLVGYGLVEVAPPRPLHLGDLRDPELDRLGLDRTQLVTTPSEHYPCTRRWATALHAAAPGADGLLWHSRQAELAAGVGAAQLDAAEREVFVLFGDRVPTGRGDYRRLAPGVGSLLEGAGWLLVSHLCDQLDAVLDPTHP